MAESVDATVFKTEVLSGACRFESGCGHQFIATNKVKEMANARDQMKMIADELALVRSQIEKLRIEEELLLKMKAKMSGEAAPGKKGRSRSPSVKPVVLDIMKEYAAEGATTAEVDELVRRYVPTVAKDTVGSVLSRLKSEGALVFDGERYYEKKYAPKSDPSPFKGGLRAVS